MTMPEKRPAAAADTVAAWGLTPVHPHGGHPYGPPPPPPRLREPMRPGRFRALVALGLVLAFALGLVAVFAIEGPPATAAFAEPLVEAHVPGGRLRAAERAPAMLDLTPDSLNAQPTVRQLDWYWHSSGVVLSFADYTTCGSADGYGSLEALDADFDAELLLTAFTRRIRSDLAVLMR